MFVTETVGRKPNVAVPVGSVAGVLATLLVIIGVIVAICCRFRGSLQGRKKDQ